MTYPLFAPPVELASKPPRSWSKAEADSYFRWFMESAELRTDNLIRFLGLNAADAPAAMLVAAQSQLEALLPHAPFTVQTSSERRLSNQGYAIAADMGLLVASLILEKGNGKVKWTVLRKPVTDQSFNLPVLVGFSKFHLDPIAGSISDASWIVRGNEKSRAWAYTFEYWTARIEG